MKIHTVQSMWKVDGHRYEVTGIANLFFIDELRRAAARGAPMEVGLGRGGPAQGSTQIPCLGSVFVWAIQEIWALSWDLAQFPGIFPNSLEISQSAKCCCRAGV
jgi:hypothetical protein